MIVWHIAGNLESRFTDFLTTDGEKPWRNRDSEFEAADADRAPRSRRSGTGAGASSLARSRSSPMTI